MTNEITDKVKQRVLEITNQVYKKHEKKIFKQVPKYRDPESGMSMIDFIEEVLKDMSLSQEDRERIENYKKLPDIYETEEWIDQKASDKYMKELDKRLLEEVKQKRLPEIIKTTIYGNKKRNSTKVSEQQAEAN